MEKLALAILALALIVVAPASAQNTVPVKNALVVVSGQEDLIVQSMLATGGSPYNVQKALEITDLLFACLLIITAISFANDIGLIPALLVTMIT